jgi:hypothetical protein
MLPPGTVVMDANVLGRLTRPPDRAQLASSLRVADLMPWPTAVNLLEAVRHENATVRLRLLEILRDLSGNRFVLPMPAEFLMRVGRMVAAGDHSFDHEPSDFEWMLFEPERITREQVAYAGRILDEAEDRFSDMHRTARRRLRGYLKARGSGDPWGDIPTFLDQQWMRPSHIDSYIVQMWKDLELDGDAPVEALRGNEAWRLYFEGFGATVYERAIQSQSQQPAHLYDVLQLIYLSGTTKRILVTNDRGLLRVAQAVTYRRYSNLRVMSNDEFLEAAP